MDQDCPSKDAGVRGTSFRYNTELTLKRTVTLSPFRALPVLTTSRQIGFS